jgi:hypothetical protein
MPELLQAWPTYTGTNILTTHSSVGPHQVIRGPGRVAGVYLTRSMQYAKQGEYVLVAALHEPNCRRRGYNG